IVLAALTASPALAATRYRATNNEAGKAAFAMQRSDSVVNNGRIVGADPDAAVRADLLHQSESMLVNGR
ncbi:MAG: hypothetical protein ACR2K5_12570, partial [Pseudolabrys sp.]